jgi:hypothetical protein
VSNCLVKGEFVKVNARLGLLGAAFGGKRTAGRSVHTSPAK